MQLTLLGTGNATVTECYNTCFVLSEGDRHFLVDGGGGSGLFTQMKHAGIDWKAVRDIFVTHRHADHLFGILWMIRSIFQAMREHTYPGDVRLYAHADLIRSIREASLILLSSKATRFFKGRFHLIPVADGDTHTILGRPVTFFDIHSPKTKQFGFSIAYAPGKRLVCYGDDAYNPATEAYAKGADWMLHEAFCLHAEIDRFKPYEKLHSTVKDACEAAQSLGIKNLLLFHTEDTNLAQRKTRYTAEGSHYFTGHLYVPNDLETLPLT